MMNNAKQEDDGSHHSAEKQFLAIKEAWAKLSLNVYQNFVLKNKFKG